VRVEEVFAAAGINIRGEPIPERRINAVCPECGQAESLDNMQTMESSDETTYECPNCGGAVIRVTAGPLPTVRPGAYRLGDWVVIPLGGMTIDVPGPGEAI
jgi:predicted RNA-binding Zn-ribbon protein involved in translation (DUF1610 family)